MLGFSKIFYVYFQALQLIPRKTYYLATKIGRYGPDYFSFDFTFDRTLKSFEESLTRLGVDYIDVLQVFFFICTVLLIYFIVLKRKKNGCNIPVNVAFNSID